MINYPPGVTGNEPEIAGYPRCGNCGCPDDVHNESGPCEECDCQEYSQYPPEPDPDLERDRQLESAYD